MWASDRIAPGATLLVLALLASGCATGRDLWPAERLDPHSAVNTTIMVQPWVYNRDVPALAANARDYLNVGVVETNRAGQRSYWLGVVAWSTIDRSALPVPAQPVKPGKVRFSWPDGSLELQPVPAGREVLGASEPIFAGPQLRFEDAWYMLSAEQLSRLAKAPPASVSLLSEDGGEIDYAAWRVEQRALDRFLEATGFTPRDP